MRKPSIYSSVSPLLGSKNVDRRILNIAFRSPIRVDVVRTPARIDVVEAISDMCFEDCRTGAIEAARYCGIPLDNFLFSRYNECDMNTIITTNDAEGLTPAEDEIRSFGQVVSSIAIFSDGYAVFGRTLREDT